MEGIPLMIILCSNHQCNQLIGEYVQVRNEIWLLIGGVKLFAAHGICANCGKEYHFYASEKKLEKIIARLKAIELTST